MERRQFFRLAGAATVLATVPQLVHQEIVDAATRLNGIDYRFKFTRALKRPPRANLTPARVDSLTVDVQQFTQQVLTGSPATTLYGYGVAGHEPSWPGPTIVARAGETAYVTWRNRLPRGRAKLTQPGGHLLPVDVTLLDEGMTALPAGEKPIVTHLHGAHAEWESDGHPEAWFTQSGRKGKFWRKKRYVYDNSQDGATLWYHDHTHGMTRLNVYAGMAGAYLLRDRNEVQLLERGVLPAEAYEYELMLQDRQFTDDGQLFLDTTADPANGTQVSAFGDFIMVNGRPWPLLAVEPRKYRFRLVNGADSRTFVLQLSNSRSILVVGTELGMLPKAVATKRLAVGPGERYDIVLDFTLEKAGTEVVLINRGIDGPLYGFRRGSTVTNRPANAAFGPAGATVADPNSSGLVMKFAVTKKRSSHKNATVKTGTKLGPAISARRATKTRGVIAFSGVDSLGRQMEMLGSLDGGTKEWMDPVTEVVAKGTTEIWEIYNTTPQTHPIHLHLVDFRVLDRAPFRFTSVPKGMTDGGIGAVISVTGRGRRRAPEPYERGRKDTVLCYPGEVTRVVATFDRTGNFVWHCHLLHHEDHDMMRPVRVR